MVYLFLFLVVAVLFIGYIILCKKDSDETASDNSGGGIEKEKPEKADGDENSHKENVENEECIK